MSRYQSLVAALDGELLLDDLEQFNEFGAGLGAGMNRIAYDGQDRAGRAWIEARMRQLGMAVRVDAIGNTIATYPGSEPDLPPLAMGSHTDTVPDGGRYDGVLGVLAALACVRTLHTNGVRLRHPVEIINFAAEEATMSGATLGSRAMAGVLSEAVLDQPAWDGRPVAEHLRSAGIDPAKFHQAARPKGSLAAYLELHIEQGSTLDRMGIPIGIVTGIVGIWRYVVTFHGYANHAGTTPMDDRRDALVAAAPFITAVRDIALKHGIVGTVGTIHISPGAPNVIPGEVMVHAEIRGLDDAVLNRASAELAHLAAAAGADFVEVSRKSAVMSDPRLMDALAAASEELNLPYRRMPSGAGHDAMCIADLAPEAMVFIPNRDGVSHSPDEYAAPDACVRGARVLFGALLRLDEQL